LEQRFAAAWKRHAERPPRQSASAATAKVTLRILHRPAHRRTGWFLTAAAAVLLAAVAGTVFWRPARTIPEPLRVTDRESSPLGSGEVLMWIDDQTPLYMTFQVPEEEQGKGGKT
jgi:hypothetical protein